MIEESKYSSDMIKKHFNKELIMNKEDNEDFKNSTKCWIYVNDYIDTDIKVRDHCHITGKYGGSAHRDCNTNLKLCRKIPIVFHNLNNYGSHPVMQELGKFNLKIIPNGLEKYMSFSISNKLSFIDRFHFLSSSLGNLVYNLNKDHFKYLSQEFDNNVLDLVKQKGFYPYEYMTDFEKLKEELRSKEKFYSFLTDIKIIDEVYEHVINVWKNFEMKTMKDYRDLYLKCDILLLTDVSEKFKNNNLKNYGLCPSHYLSAPGLSWDAMLKKTKIKLGLIPDPDMYIFFEKDTRGGIYYISNRYSKANNKYLKSYDSEHIYLGANNLYGYAMSNFLPTSGFKWADP